MGTIKTTNIETITGSGTLTLGQSGETVSIPTNTTLGASGTTITVPSGCTITNNGTQTGFGGANSPYFQAYQSGSAQTIGDTWTKVQINDEIVDSANAYDNSSNYRFTPQTAGKYFIYGQVTSATSTDMDRCMSGIYLNGSRVSQTNSYNGDSSSAHTATIVDLNGSSDYVELYGYFGVSTSTDLQGRACFFGGYKLID